MEHTTLVSILHSANRIPVLRAQAEACCCAVIVRVYHFVCKNPLVVDRLRLAIIQMSVGGAIRKSQGVNSR